MRVLKAAMVAAGLLAATPALAIDPVDLGATSCKDFIAAGEENISYVMMWLDGYYSTADAALVMDFDAMKVKGEKLGAFCAANPDTMLTVAAEPIWAPQ